MGIFVPAFGKAHFLEVRTKRAVAIGETSVAERDRMLGPRPALWREVFRRADMELLPV